MFGAEVSPLINSVLILSLGMSSISILLIACNVSGSKVPPVLAANLIALIALTGSSASLSAGSPIALTTGTWLKSLTRLPFSSIEAPKSAKPPTWSIISSVARSYAIPLIVKSLRETSSLSDTPSILAPPSGRSALYVAISYSFPAPVV